MGSGDEAVAREALKEGDEARWQVDLDRVRLVGQSDVLPLESIGPEKLVREQR